MKPSLLHSNSQHVRTALLAALIAITAVATNAQTLFGSATIITPGHNSGHAVNLTSDAMLGTYSGIDFPVPPGLTLAGLTHLGSDYMVTAGDCSTGSPRFQVNVAGVNIFVYIGLYPNYNCPFAFNTWTNSGDLIAAPNPIFDTSQLPGGTFYMSYAQMITDYGSLVVTGIQLVVDSGFATPPDETIEVDNVVIGPNTYTFDPLGPTPVPTDAYQISYAANLNIGDSVINLSNSGIQGTFFNATPPTIGNLCVNVYAFDPSEEEITCCSCLVTPNGLNALSAKGDLLNNRLTPGVVTSLVVKLVASQPGVDTNGAYTQCDPSAVNSGTAAIPYNSRGTGSLASGLTAWGSTVEPALVGGYGAVRVPFKKETLTLPELTALTTVCNFIEKDASGFGICGSCRNNGLQGAKK